MAYIYRYIDMADNQIKYVGIVWGKTRTLQQRIREHSYFDAWCKSSKWLIEYYSSNITTRTDAEFYESHLISLYKTDKYYNKSKSGWGVSHFLPEIPENAWKIYTNNNLLMPLCDIEKIKSYKRETKSLYYELGNKEIAPLKYSLHINKGIWHVSFYIKDVNGKRKQKQLSTGFKAYNSSKEINKDKANKKACEIVMKYATSNCLNPEKWSFDTYAQNWLLEHKSLITSSTYSRYSSMLNRHIIPYFSILGLSLGIVTTENLRQYCEYKIENGLQKTTIIKHINLIHLIFEDALNKGYIKFNPCIVGFSKQYKD